MTSRPFEQRRGQGQRGRQRPQSQVQEALSYALSYGQPRFNPRGGGGAVESGFRIGEQIAAKNQEQTEREAFAGLLEQALQRNEQVSGAAEGFDPMDEAMGMPSFGLPDAINPFMDIQARARAGDPSAIGEMNDVLGSALQQQVPETPMPNQDILEMAMTNPAIASLVQDVSPAGRDQAIADEQAQRMQGMQQRFADRAAFEDPMNNKFSAKVHLQQGEYGDVAKQMFKVPGLNSLLNTDEGRAFMLEAVPLLGSGAVEDISDLTRGQSGVAHAYSEGGLQPGDLANALSTSGQFRIGNVTYKSGRTDDQRAAWNKSLDEAIGKAGVDDNDQPINSRRNVLALVEQFATGVPVPGDIKPSDAEYRIARDQYKELLKDGGMKFVAQDQSGNHLTLDGSGVFRDQTMRRQRVNTYVSQANEATLAKKYGFDNAQIEKIHRDLEKFMEPFKPAMDLYRNEMDEYLQTERGVTDQGQREGIINELSPQFLNSLINDQDALRNATRKWPEFWKEHALAPMLEALNAQGVEDNGGFTPQAQKEINAGQAKQEHDLEQNALAEDMQQQDPWAQLGDMVGAHPEHPGVNPTGGFDLSGQAQPPGKAATPPHPLASQAWDTAQGRMTSATSGLDEFIRRTMGGDGEFNEGDDYMNLPPNQVFIPPGKNPKIELPVETPKKK